MRMRYKPTRKQSRQDMMLKIIKEKSVETQEELQKLLDKFHFSTTQSSLSRDIAELGLIKQHGVYIVPPRQKHGVSLPTIASIESAGPNLVVIKTLIGMAAPVGLTLDERKLANVVGTVAGDDTVFVAVAPGAQHENIKKNIRNLFKGA